MYTTENEYKAWIMNNNVSALNESTSLSLLVGQRSYGSSFSLASLHKVCYTVVDLQILYKKAEGAANALPYELKFSYTLEVSH